MSWRSATAGSGPPAAKQFDDDIDNSDDKQLSQAESHRRRALRPFGRAAILVFPIRAKQGLSDGKRTMSGREAH
jgi:hypothetical protein